MGPPGAAEGAAGRAPRRIFVVTSLPSVASAQLVTAAVALVVLWLAFDAGTFSLQSRTAAAVVVWWLILVGLAVRVIPVAELRAAAITTGSLLLAFGFVTLASSAWGASAEDAVVEFSRVGLYLGVFILAAGAVPLPQAARWLDGIAIALCAVAAVALTSRFFPGAFPDPEHLRFLPDAHTRLSYPVSYWNGLAILVALACPLLLRVALTGRSPSVRALALAAFPVIACVVYLASSRSGAVTAVLGCALFVALVDRTWAGVAATALGVGGGVAAIAVVAIHDELVDGPLDSAAAAAQGRLAAVSVAAICLAVAAGFLLGERAFRRRGAPSRALGWTLAAAGALVVAVGLVQADLAARWAEFTRPPARVGGEDYIRTHFISANSNWRWQYWRSSLEQFENNPLLGGGAATYEAWWAQHGNTIGFIANPHSLYFQVLGELGAVGLGLLLAAFAVALASAARRARRARGAARVTASAVVAAAAAYVVAVGLDWMWQLTAVSVVGFALLGLASGSATAAGSPGTGPGPLSAAARIAAVGAAVVMIAIQVDVLAADAKLRDSQAAARRGDLSAAAGAAAAARELHPWAASPYVQLALVAEEAGDLRSAVRWIAEATERDASDWRVWLIAARVETKRGRTATAERHLDRAIELNPRSPLFSDLARRPGGGG